MAQTTLHTTFAQQTVPQPHVVSFRLQIQLQQSQQVSPLLPQQSQQTQQQPQQQPQTSLPQCEPTQPPHEQVNMAQVIQFLQLVQQLKGSAQFLPNPHMPTNLPQPIRQSIHQYPTHQCQLIHQHQPIHQHTHQHGSVRQQYQRRFRPYHPHSATQTCAGAHHTCAEASRHVTTAEPLSPAASSLPPIASSHAYHPHAPAAEVPNSVETSSHATPEPTPPSPPSPNTNDDVEMRTIPKRTDYTYEFKERFSKILQSSDEAQTAWRTFRDAHTPCTVARSPCIRVYREFCEDLGGELRELSSEGKFEKLGTLTKCGCSS